MILVPQQTFTEEENTRKNVSKFVAATLCYNLDKVIVPMQMALEFNQIKIHMRSQ